SKPDRFWDINVSFFCAQHKAKQTSKDKNEDVLIVLDGESDKRTREIENQNDQFGQVGWFAVSFGADLCRRREDEQRHSDNGKSQGDDGIDERFFSPKFFVARANESDNGVDGENGNQDRATRFGESACEEGEQCNENRFGGRAVL